VGRCKLYLEIPSKREKFVKSNKPVITDSYNKAKYVLPKSKNEKVVIMDESKS